MSWKSLRVAILLPLCLAFAAKALAQRNMETVIVIQDTTLENGAPHGTPVKRGQSLQVYHRSGGRLYVLNEALENRRGRSWGWIDASCALRPDQAVPHFSSLLQKDPKDATAYLGRAAAELALDQHGKAIADCEKVLQLDPTSISAFHLRARSWIAKEHPDKAIADLGQVLRLDPKQADAYRLRGDLWRKQKNHEKAIADYSRLLQLRPHDCEAYYSRGFSRLEKKEYEKALADFNEVLSRQPEASYGYNGRCRAWYCLRAYDKAEDDITECIRLYDRETANLCRVAWYYVFQGDLRQALKSFEQFQKTFLRGSGNYLDRAKCHEALGDSDKAIADCNEALWIDPNSVRCYHLRGAYWLEKKRFDLAMADFDVALKLDPKFTLTYHVLRGCCRAEMGQNDKALADFDEALRLDPEDMWACNAAAWFRATCEEAKYRDGKQAVILATKACQRADWDSYASIDTLAAAHAEAGNFDEAVRRQKKALELAPPAAKKKMVERLALYESHKPYRESSETGKQRGDTEKKDRKM